MSASIALLSQLLIGESGEVRRLRALVEKVAVSPLSVLISGPTGAGKELVAEAIHRLSCRPGPLVAVNICAVPETMFESTLFGHVRGAFTGAVGESIGLLGEAHGGTLFLDEIGALPVRDQPKLLRVLETRIYRAVGARQDRASDFRLLAATNEDLDAAVESGRFREDLRHRMGHVTIRVPSLAERRDDIPLLVRHFADAVTGDESLKIDDDAMLLLYQQAWPGNVRELRSAVVTLAALNDTGRVRRHDVVAVLGHRLSGPLAGAPAEAYRAVGRAREELVRTLERHAWDTSLVASELRVHRVTVYRRMKSLGISIPFGARQATSEPGVT